jgi:hypothetical protein
VVAEQTGGGDKAQGGGLTIVWEDLVVVVRTGDGGDGRKVRKDRSL